LAELLAGRPLFQGKDKLNQIQLIIDIHGTPTEEEIEAIQSDEIRDYVKKLPSKQKVPFVELFPATNPLALDLLDKMLSFNPKCRISVPEALGHLYLQILHDPQDEPIAKETFKDELENKDLTCEEYRELILQLVSRFEQHNQ